MAVGEVGSWGVGTAKSVRWRLWAKPCKLVSGHPVLLLKYWFSVTNQLVQAVKFVQDKARLANFYTKTFLRNVLYWTRGHQQSVIFSSLNWSCKTFINNIDFCSHVKSSANFPDIPRVSWDGRWRGKYCHGVGTEKPVRWHRWAKPCKLVSGHPVLPLKDWFSVTNQLVQGVKFVHTSGYQLKEL